MRQEGNSILATTLEVPGLIGPTSHRDKQKLKVVMLQDTTVKRYQNLNLDYLGVVHVLAPL